MPTMKVKGRKVSVISKGPEDYIWITNIARYKNSDRTDDLIRN